MKLKTKIQLYSALIMFILLLIVNTSIYFLYYKNATESQLEQLASQTDNLVARLAENTEPDETGDLINAFLPVHGMAKVFPREGQPLEFKYREEAYRTLEGEFTTEETREVIKPESGIHIAVVTKPIIWLDGEVVTLQVSNNLIEFTETMRTLLYVLIIASVIVLIPTVIGSNILARILLRPIHQLTQAMKENMKERKWKKINLEHPSKDELYEMEATFNEMIDQLKANFEKQEDFVSNASHELKTPIQIVKSYAELMKRRGLDHPDLLAESIEAIDSEADRMKHLVEQLLALAKNKTSVQAKVELVQIIERSLEMFKGAYSREIEFHKNVDTVHVWGNSGQLEQIAYILVDNALKYSEDKIVVSLFTYNGEVIFSVKDFGEGISKEDQERIFERFYRVDKARSRETGGTGIGLSIAQDIVFEHKGRLSLESEVGQGTTFTLALPIYTSSEERTE